MSTFTTIAQLTRLNDRELDILFRSVTARLAGYAEGTAERRSGLCQTDTVWVGSALEHGHSRPA